MNVFVGYNQAVISGLARACEVLWVAQCEEIIALVDPFPVVSCQFIKVE